jgi:hypothetical protein
MRVELCPRELIIKGDLILCAKALVRFLWANFSNDLDRCVESY